MNRRLQLLSTIALGTIAIVALFAYLLWSGYREKMESAATTTRNYAAIIEARLDATFRRAEAHLQELAKGLPLEALDKQAVPRFAKALDAGLDARRLNFPELVGLRVFDTAGDLIYASESATTQRANAADRDYFREARDNPGANLVFSEVAISRITGRPALFVAKAVRDDKGAFRGLVSASVELEYFQKLFESLDIGKEGLITIFRSDTFTPVLRRPAIADGKNLPMRPSLPARQAVASGKKNGTFEVASPVDNVTRIYSIRILSGYPFYVGVGISTRDALAGWQTRSIAVSMAGLLLLGLLLAVLHRLWHLGLARDQLAAIVENSNYAILGRDLDGVIVSWNAGAEKMLGYSAAEAIGRTPDFCLPPGHPSRVRQNTERLLRGELVEHESERLTRDGRILNVFTSHSPIRDSTGNIIEIGRAHV